MMVQNKFESLNRHNNTDYFKKNINEWIIHNEFHQENAFDNEELKVKRLLNKHPLIRKLAIDIGCGAGWMSDKLSYIFENVIAIEPSQKAIDICKTLYGNKKNISWICDFAENVIDNLNKQNNSPVFINTCSVFMHLENNIVDPILKSINKNVPPGSILSFQEPFSSTTPYENNNELIFIRTKEYYSSILNNWNVDFHGPDMSRFGHPFIKIHKGIHAVKIK